MIQLLDRNLFIGGEVKEVYDELLKTLDEDHLNFELVSQRFLRKYGISAAEMRKSWNSRGENSTFRILVISIKKLIDFKNNRINKLFFKDKYVQKAPTSLKFEPAFTSSVLRNFGRTKAINSDLVEISRGTAPWTGQDFKNWNKT